jgi:hypothetical protein
VAALLAAALHPCIGRRHASVASARISPHAPASARAVRRRRRHAGGDHGLIHRVVGEHLAAVHPQCFGGACVRHG